MLRQYSNKKIYKNLNIARRLAIINLALFIFVLFWDVIGLFVWGITPSWGDLPVFNHDGLFYNDGLLYLIMSLLIIVFAQILFPIVIESFKKKDNRTEAKDNNDVNSIKRIISITFFPCYYQFFIFFVNVGGTGWIAVYVLSCWLGYTLGSCLLIYIADIFLGITCKLIREEWKSAPPKFILEEKKAKAAREKEIEREKQELIERDNNKMYENLIQQCGVRFFIKYYEQIERLPLRDVLITEDYPYFEKEERLQAAREIIDKNLQVLAFENILQSYSAMLDSAEIEKAKAILQYLKNKN